MSDPMILRLDETVTLRPRTIGTQSGAIAHHGGLGQYFQFGPEEAFVVGLIDGRRGMTELTAAIHDAGMDWTPEEISEFLSMLVRGHVLIASGDPASGRPDGRDAGEGGAGDADAPVRDDPLLRQEASLAQAARTRLWLGSLSSVISLRFPIMNFDGVARRLVGHVGWLFTPVGVLLWSMLVGSSFVLMLSSQDAFKTDLRRIFDASMWMPLLVIWVICKAVHETGHAVAASRQGVTVGKTGIMFFLLAPLAYVDVTDAWKLPGRFARVQIALAGVYLELGVAAVAAWAWYWLPDGRGQYLAAQVFVVAGPATILVNANPLLRLDGYYVLSDWVDVPNLRTHGRKQLVGCIERMLLGIKPQRSLLFGWRRGFATMHAVASVVFQVVWMSGLVIAVSYWAHGLGVLVACVAVLLWAVLPLLRWSIFRWNNDGSWRSRRRFVGALFTLFLIGQWVSASRSPLHRRVPIVVQNTDEQIARASADAFVTGVYVSAGDRVDVGTMMMELEDAELRVRRDQIADRLELARHRAIQFRRQNELAKADGEAEQAVSLERQLVELDGQLAELRVIATRNGIVTTPRTDELLGSFVNAGDELLRVSDPHEKELLVSVSEKDISAYTLAARRAEPVRVRFRGGGRIQALPTALEPRARTSLPHPALAATAGGPLPVQPGERAGDVETIAPRMQAVSRVRSVVATAIRDGQIGTMVISDDRSLGERLMQWMTGAER